MLRINKLTDYATIILREMARSPEDVCNAATIAARSQIPLPTVSKILKKLHKSGIISSFRGAEGGYKLNIEPPKISVLTIIAAMEGKVAMTECSMSIGSCQQESSCEMKSNWRSINRTVLESLAKITVADLLQELQVESR